MGAAAVIFRGRLEVSELGEHVSPAPEPVGVEQNCHLIAEALTSGTSIVLVGALGSGKSYLVRDVVSHLHDAGVDPLILRPGGPLAGVAFGVLDAVTDPRAAALRENRLLGEEAPVIVVDDAHELDEASAAAVVRAVHGGRATALLGVTVRRDGTPTDPGGAGALAVDLWLRGLADRIDLGELSPQDADELLTQFGYDDFDALTRASVIGLADGSRLLLREIATVAATARRLGRDPIAAMREAPVGGRLSDVLAAHTAQLAADDRTALAILGHVPRIGFADAVRVVASSTIDDLLAAGLVYDDGTPERRLSANALLAREADRATDPTTIDAALRTAMERMLVPGSDWWSPALARQIALCWHRGSPRAPDPESIDDALRARVCLDGARMANDAGEHDLASAHARMGLRVAVTAELQLELAYAEASRGAGVDLTDLLPEIDPDHLDCDALVRWVRIMSTLPDDGLDLRRAVERMTSARPADSLCELEISLGRAQFAGLILDWTQSVEISQEILSRPGVPTPVRLRASTMGALALACLGEVDEARQWMLRAHRLSGSRDNATAAPSAERLWALSVELLVQGMAGGETADLIDRLEEECMAAALEGDEETASIIGFVTATAYATAGDADRALVELRAASTRARATVFASWGASVKIFVSRALAVLERIDDARAVLDLVDPASVATVPLMAHARLGAESCILAGEGRLEDAVASARAAALAAQSSPVFLARDLFQLVALGDGDDVVLAKLRRLAESTPSPLVQSLSEKAAELTTRRRQGGDVNPLDALRQSAVWGSPDRRLAGRRRIDIGQGAASVRHRAREAAHGDGGTTLTRREREIALLVDEGLSNREIATRLYLSVRTVESHIYQARTKVDARSRGDLGRMVARQLTSSRSGSRR